MPPAPPDFSRPSRRPITFAHRGASAHAAANSLEAFRLALRLGATGLESDLWVTADGIAVLDHQGRVKVGLRRRPISEVDWTTLAARGDRAIIALGDLYQELGSDFELCLNVMDPSATGPAVEAGRRAGPRAEGRLWLAHGDLPLLASWRERFADVRLVNRVRLRELRHGPERRAAELSATGIDAVNMHHSDWTGGHTTLFHRFQRTTFAWDAQHERIITNLVTMGLDGISGDHADRLIDAVR